MTPRHIKNRVQQGEGLQPDPRQSTSTMLTDSHSVFHEDPIFTTSENDTQEQRMVSQLATERALFMTPSAHWMTLPPFPGSPVSDPCSNSSEADRGREDMRSSRSPNTEATTHPTISHHAFDDYTPCMTDEDEDGTTLEMPDGSTRMSSNWLPVDLTAGFTIGSHSTRKVHEKNNCLHLDELPYIREAFISTSAAEWAYGG